MFEDADIKRLYRDLLIALEAKKEGQPGRIARELAIAVTHLEDSQLRFEHVLATHSPVEVVRESL